MRIRFTSPAAMLLIAGLAGLATPALAEPEPFGRLEVAQVEALLGQKGVLIVDVNSAEVYRKGHVPGAVWSAMDEVEKNLPADRSTKLIYYCHNQL
jgi:3-mercaptopyruvate sulfurtransferase SseA